MYNPWKLATTALVLINVTALSTGVTTAYFMRQPTPVATPAPAATLSMMEPAAARPTPIQPAVAAPPEVQPAVVTQPAVQSAVVTRPAVVRPVAVRTVADECSTGGQRAMKVAKPGLIGALGGAGLGAIGGAIANGGSGAGKGALIGGLAGTALGAGYGAYKTKNECGTIFGGGNGFDAAPASPASRADTVQTFSPATGGDRIQVYGVR